MVPSWPSSPQAPKTTHRYGTAVNTENLAVLSLDLLFSCVAVAGVLAALLLTSRFREVRMACAPMVSPLVCSLLHL